MSVKHLPGNRLRLECDTLKCPNRYDLDNSQQAMAAANEWTQRHGWRTIITGNIQQHFCPPCSSKDSRFEVRQRARKIGSQAGTEHVHPRQSNG